LIKKIKYGDQVLPLVYRRTENTFYLSKSLSIGVDLLWILCVS